VRTLHVLQGVGIALLHVILATVAVPVSSAMLYYVVKPVLSPFDSLGHDVPLIWPFFPVQSLVGLLTGFLLFVRRTRFGRSRVARFVWIIPAAWFSLMFLAWGSHSVLSENRWEHFFLSGLGDSKREQIFITLPLLTSVAYAFGNYLGGRYEQSRGTGA
jgi:hypothetical protein